jgi:Acyl-CoA reductase (LuxC)
MSHAADRVRSVLDAAAAVYEKRALLVGELAASTGLSPEGVLFALEHSLERDVSQQKIEVFAARARPHDGVLVVLSSNIFLGCVRALAWAVASSQNVSVRPSRRESRFFELVHAELRARGFALPIADSVAEASHGVIHVYGSDETIASITLGARLPVQGFGTGFGVASASVSEASARLIARDIVLFDQRGCLSPRVVLVPGDLGEAERMAQLLSQALSEQNANVPRGHQSEAEQAESALYTEVVRATGSATVGASACVGASNAFLLPPSGRNIHVVPIAQALPALNRAASKISAWGTDLDASLPRSITAFRGRISALGTMQSPPFDGPVDLRGLGS